MNVYLWQVLEAYFKSYKDKLEDAYYESFLYDISCFFRNLPVIIKANISLLLFFNKNKCYFDWDYDFLYDLISWKLEQIKENMEGVEVAGTGDRRNLISDEIQCVLDCLTLYRDPEITSSESDTTADEYYRRLYEVEEDCWNDFHDLLKDKARGWWD